MSGICVAASVKGVMAGAALASPWITSETCMAGDGPNREVVHRIGTTILLSAVVGVLGPTKGVAAMAALYIGRETIPLMMRYPASSFYAFCVLSVTSVILAYS